MSERFHALVDLMAALRAPDGCPWDRKQTHESLKPYLLEETYEVLEVLDRQDRAKLPEELGDVLLQVLFHSQIASETGSFTIEDVLEQLADKLIRRHPHVFGNGAADPTPMNADQVVARWEEIKRTERQASGRPDSTLDGVPQTLPALLRAYQLQARASRVGFDWTHDAKGFDQVLGKIEEEIQELRVAIRAPASNQTEPARRRCNSSTRADRRGVRRRSVFTRESRPLHQSKPGGRSASGRQPIRRTISFHRSPSDGVGPYDWRAVVCGNGSTVERSQEAGSCHTHQEIPP